MYPTAKKTAARKVPPVKIEDAKLIYKNFSGAKKRFNLEGYRNFHVVLDVDLARVMEKDGWNIRWHDPREETDEPWASIKVAVRFDNFPPRIVLVNKSGNKTVLDEDGVGLLDWASIKTADLILTPSYWEVNDEKGIKAYLNKMFVILDDDDLEAKYSNVGPDKDSEEDESD